MKSSLKTKQIVYLPLKSIVPDENQPRQYFDATKLASLANSIKRIGIKKPLVVEDTQDGKYKLIDGERRFRSASIAGLKEVPVLIEAPMSVADRLVEQFHIQEQHEGWRPTEKAIAIRDIANSLDMSVKEIAVLVGIHEDRVEDYIAFINLLAHKEMVKSEVPIAYAPKIQSVTNGVVKNYLAQEGKDLSPEVQKEFQIGLLKRIKSGEITVSTHLLKVKDSATQNAKKTVHDIIKTDKSIDRLFNETNAKEARIYRKFGNDIRLISQDHKSFSGSAVLLAQLESDETLKRNIRSLIKRLQSLPL